MWHYRICGLDVLSELELPGAVPAAPLAEEPDVMVRRGSAPKELPEASLSGPHWAMAGDRFLLSVPEVARFLITSGREITVATEPGTEESDAVIFLLGSALSILLHQRGRMVLHASAVAVAGKVVLFCGPSGAGKSTLAAALNAGGYPFVNDDICCVGVAPGEQPTVLPDGRLLKLWDDALGHLRLADRRGAAVRRQLLKFYVPPSETVSSA
ncbi:MAG: AAA family ATPase, partial [Propylenella sp.]